jgi:small conductance mechanosensitive channel
MESLFNDQAEIFNTYVVPWSINIVMALVVFVVGRWLAKAISRLTRKIMRKASVEEILINFIGNIVYTALLVVVIIAALDQLGINTASILAVFAAAGLAVGLALKDSLANFAAGVMLVLFKPFKAGDFVEVAGHQGVIEHIRIFNTTLKTGDNREITIPNGNIFGNSIVNYSARDTRRIDLVIGIGYGDDLRKARTLIEEVIKADGRILAEPEPVVMLLELADSSVNFAVRPWVKSEDYWAVRADLLENIKTKFDSNGISIPFPQREIHVYQAS